MASFCVSAPSIASAASSISGLSISSTPRPSSRASPPSPVRPLAISKKQSASPDSPLSDDRDMRRRAVVFAAFASALSLASAGAVLAADPTKKKEKCPTICVQNRTASCCYGN